MNPKPLRRQQIKRRRAGRPRISSRVLDPEYLAFLSSLPCAICYADAYRILGFDITAFATERSMYGRQKSPTEAAHVGFSDSRRGLSQKFPDPESIPLCADEHHRNGEFSIHKMGAEAFFAHHGADRDGTILVFQSMYAEHCR